VIGVIVLKIDRAFDGLRFGLFSALYAAARLIIEAFRGDSTVINGVRTAQVWSLLGIVVALWLLRHWAAAQQAATHSSTLKVSDD
jgi:prolipoprotein diacylglyceryltransferase